MTSEEAAVAAAYLEHLTDEDVALVGHGYLNGGPPSDNRAQLRNRRGGIEDLLRSSGVFRAVFGPGSASDPLLRASPFLAFAVAVQRAAVDLASVTYTPEWVGAGRWAPVFDAGRLREFASSPWRRFFLAELLASYTHVNSGSVLVATRRGFRRQRFSELDPVRLAGLLEVVSDAERPGVLRRLGDLALFLTGVFPDYVARRGFGPVEQSRLARAGGTTAGRVPARPGADRVGLGPAEDDAVAILDLLGRRWYQAAFQLLRPGPIPDNVAVLGELPERFGDARRILGVVRERYLFADRDRWFGIGPH
jgi:hypothetical protein